MVLAPFAPHPQPNQRTGSKAYALGGGPGGKAPWWGLGRSPGLASLKRMLG
jgi:hypothetical protein